MKRLLLTLLATTLTMIAIPLSTSAAPSQTDISGTVTNNGKAVDGANVTVVCNNNDRKDTTNAEGGYLVHFITTECPNGAQATVVATDGKKGGTNDGKVNDLTSKLNVSIINVALPEFGLITAFGAAVIGGGAFMIMRRRQLQS
jgi:hypothetical protein